MASTSLPIYLFTFNCARLLITPSIVATHLFSALDPSAPPPEIIAIGLQEVAPISYAFLGGEYLLPYLDRWSSVPHLAAQYLHSVNKAFPAEYVELGRCTVGMTALLVFGRRAERVKNLRFGSVGFGFFGMANKGAVAVRFGYSVDEGEEVGVTIVATHLAAHEHCCTDRNGDWETLSRGVIFETPASGENTESTPLLSESTVGGRETSGIYQKSSHLLVMGDLNYRTSHTSPTPEDLPSFPRRKSDDFTQFFKRDQLTRELNAGNTLHGLTEAPITFPPTYKYREDILSLLEDTEVGSTDKHSDSDEILDWSRNRWPSWCDRILWLPVSPSSSKEEEIKVHKYTSIPEIRFSDHKPVGLHISLPLITTPKSLAGDNNDLRTNPPFPLDKDWKAKRYNAQVKEWVVGYAILVATTANGLTLLGCMVLGAGMLWWGVTGRV
ncbi:hypothetical protein TWF481_006867 [Arthrobotrys musiformis]|uniref:Inositol polyphosphate-related phosphatase domain-containing protein n=1 Tax=Arthrobotrys musiformis TaxID=47236 RepID=A0AAV9WFI0_9PEZI